MQLLSYLWVFAVSLIATTSGQSGPKNGLVNMRRDHSVILAGNSALLNGNSAIRNGNSADGNFNGYDYSRPSGAGFQLPQDNRPQQQANANSGYESHTNYNPVNFDGGFGLISNSDAVNQNTAFPPFTNTNPAIQNDGFNGINFNSGSGLDGRTNVINQNDGFAVQSNTNSATYNNGGGGGAGGGGLGSGGGFDSQQSVVSVNQNNRITSNQKKATKKGNRHSQGHGGKRVQTIRVIHENRGTHAQHTNTNNNNVKTVRIVHETRGLGNHGNTNSHHGNVQTVKIVHEGGRPGATGYSDINSKVLQILNNEHALSEVSGRSTGLQKSIRIIQDSPIETHAHSIDNTKTLQILENPTAGAYGNGNNNDIDIQTLQSLLNSAGGYQDSSLKTLKLIGDGTSGAHAYGYNIPHNAVGNQIVTLRVLGDAGTGVSAAAAAYPQSAFTTAAVGDYKTVLQDPGTIQYASQPHQLDGYKLIGTPQLQHVSPAQEYKTVTQFLPDSQYGHVAGGDVGGGGIAAAGGTTYGSSSLTGLDSIFKILQTSGINTSNAGHGQLKFLRVLKK